MSKASNYLATLIARSSKSQVEIAREVEYPHPNILSMFKSGKTKIPINMVIPLSVALNGDPVFMLKLVLEEHLPDCHEDILNLVRSGEVLTSNEKSLLALCREVMNGMDIDLQEAKIATMTKDALQQIAVVQAAGERASRDLYDSLPRNMKR